MKNTYTLTVYNTVTAQDEEVAVTKEVYDEYRRSNWRLAKANDRHEANETPFSALIGGEGGAYENFSEFVDDTQNPETLFTKQEESEALHRAVAELPEADRLLIEALFLEGLTEREYALQLGVAQTTVHWKKVRILKKLKKILR